MSYNPANPNGQATSANSAPVVIASDQSAVPVSASSLPLPASAATSTKQSDGSQKTQVVDGSGNVIGATSNALDVHIKSGGTSSGTEYSEGATATTAAGVVAMGKSSTTIKALQTDSSGNLRVDLSQTAANSTAIKVDGSAVTQPVSASSLPLPSGAATAAKQPALGTAGTASADVITVQGVTSMTALKVDGSAVTQPVSGTVSITSNSSVNINQIAGGTAINSGVTGALATGGDTASGSTDAGKPLKIGAVGHTAAPTAVTDGQRVDFIADKVGKQVVVGSIRDLKGSQQTTITSSTAETTIVTAVASTFCDLYGLVLTNTSATATKVTIKDATAGTTRFVFQVPATETRGFMLPESAAHNQATVNNNWTATCGTSVAGVEITALFVKNI